MFFFLLVFFFAIVTIGFRFFLFFACLTFPCLWDLKRKGGGGVHDDRIERYMIR